MNQCASWAQQVALCVSESCEKVARKVASWRCVPEPNASKQKCLETFQVGITYVLVTCSVRQGLMRTLKLEMRRAMAAIKRAITTGGQQGSGYGTGR